MQSSNNIDRTSFAAKTGMWLLMITIILLFTAFTFGFFSTVRQDTYIHLPNAFYFSTIILAISSIVLHKAKDIITYNRSPRVILYTVILGLFFLCIQGWGWYELYTQSITSQNSHPQGFNYLYLLSGMHAIHIVAGILFLTYVIIAYPKKGRKYLEFAIYFWHFLGLLWVYLLVVLLINL